VGLMFSGSLLELQRVCRWSLAVGGWARALRWLRETGLVGIYRAVGPQSVALSCR
jgi:hypothetical protein